MLTVSFEGHNRDETIVDILPRNREISGAWFDCQDFYFLVVLPRCGGGGEWYDNVITSAANRLIGEVVQSRRRPLLGLHI